MSSRMRYPAGTMASVMNVAPTTPNARDTAIGTMNLACTLRASSRGVSPAKVVSDVSQMGRKRRTPASCRASRSGLPSRRR